MDQLYKIKRNNPAVITTQHRLWYSTSIRHSNLHHYKRRRWRHLGPVPRDRFGWEYTSVLHQWSRNHIQRRHCKSCTWPVKWIRHEEWYSLANIQEHGYSESWYLSHKRMPNSDNTWVLPWNQNNRRLISWKTRQNQWPPDESTPRRSWNSAKTRRYLQITLTMGLQAIVS